MGAVVTISPPTMGTVTYFAFIEGPVWIGSLQKLFFSRTTRARLKSAFGRSCRRPPRPAVFMEMSGSNGMAVDNNDKLIIADQRNHPHRPC